MDKRVERYLTDNMNAAEKATFEKEVIENSGLEKEVRESRIALEVIREEGRVRLKQRLANLDEKTSVTSPNKPSNPTMPWLLGLLGLALMVYTLFFWYSPEEVENNSLVEPVIELEPKQVENIPVVKDSAIIQKESTIEKKTPKVTTSPKSNDNKTAQKPVIDNPPIAREEVDTEKSNRLFAQSFEPYRHPSLRPNVRGGAGDSSTREKFELAYWKKDYSQVLSTWENLSDVQRNNGNLLFLKAVAAMEKGRMDEATQDFQQLLNLKRHRYKQQSEWYLALAALQANEKDKAVERLNGIIENSKHKWHQKAFELLEKMN
jgi:tetratricopeptide (TPR) repeat protein